MHKDLLFSFSNVFGRAILGFVLFPLITVLYGANSLGIYSLAFVWTMCIMTIVDFGYTITIPVSISSQNLKLDLFLAKNNTSKIILLIFSWVLIGLIVSLDIFPGDSSTLCAVFFYFSVGGLYHYIVLYFRGLGDYKNEAKYSVWGGIVSILSFYFLGVFGFTLDQNIFLVSIIRFIYSIGIYKSFRSKFGINSLGFSKKYEFRSGLSAFFLTCSGVLYVYADSFLLGFFLVATDYAIYQIMIQALIIGSLAGLALSNFVIQRTPKLLISSIAPRFFLFRMLLGSLVLAIVIILAIQIILAFLYYVEWLPDRLNLIISRYLTEINTLCLLIFLRVTSSPIGAFLSGLNKTYLRVWMNLLALMSSVMFLSYVIKFSVPSIYYGLISGVVAHVVLLLVGLAISLYVTREYGDRSSHN